MLRIKLLFLLAVLTLPMSATDNPGSENKAPKASTTISESSSDLVVINSQMIEKFNKANYSSNNLSVNELLSNCNFNEIKQIAEAYVSDGLNVSNAQEIATVIERPVREDAPKRDELYLHSENMD